MISIRQSKPWLVIITSLFIANASVTQAIAAPTETHQPANSNAVFATDANAGANAEKAMPGAAAVVDGHIIPMDDVTLACLRKFRSYVIDQMVQGYVLDRECQSRGITVSDSKIDQQIADLRSNLAPATLEETLKQHQMTMTEVRNEFRRKAERTLLATEQIKPVRMIHCRQILVKFGLDSTAGSGTNRTEAAALAAVNTIQEQLKQGKDFAALAAQYSEGDDSTQRGDLGVLYDNMLGEEASVLEAAMTLHKNEVSPPVKTENGYLLLQAISTDTDHSEAENSLYQAANETSRHLQIQFLEPQIVVHLIDNSKITFVDDADLVPGKPLPDAAAVVDGHEIPMKDVAAKCLADYGPKMVDILVQNYVVSRECEKRGIKVDDAEIDRRIAALRKQIAPTSLEEGMKTHHTTMDGLRNDFRQQMERTKLALDQVKPTRLAHARTILVTADASESANGVKRTDAEAKALILKIQDQLKAGKGFAELASQYSEAGDKDKPGDIGILYAGKQGADTAMVNTALGMKPGEISPDPVKTPNGYFLLQVVSTSDKHASDEDAAYKESQAVYQEQKAQSLIPQTIVELIRQSKVVYYLHS